MILIKHIDEIARRKERDVLYLEFHPQQAPGDRTPYRYMQNEQRKSIIDWLDANGVGWDLCGPYASRRMPPYRGEIYLDVPFDEGLAAYRCVRDFLEYPDGSMRWPGVRFMALTLEMAMQNAHHDEPGYWDLT